MGTRWLRATAHTWPLAFNAGGSPLNPEHFVNAKAEAYWSLREWLERRGIVGLTDEEMHAQFAGIRYRHTASGNSSARSPAGWSRRARVA